MKPKVIETKTIGRNNLSYSVILDCIHLHFRSIYVTEKKSEIENHLQKHRHSSRCLLVESQQ